MYTRRVRSCRWWATRATRRLDCVHCVYFAAGRQRPITGAASLFKDKANSFVISAELYDARDTFELVAPHLYIDANIAVELSDAQGRLAWIRDATVALVTNRCNRGRRLYVNFVADGPNAGYLREQVSIATGSQCAELQLAFWRDWFAALNTCNVSFRLTIDHASGDWYSMREYVELHVKPYVSFHQVSM